MEYCVITALIAAGIAMMGPYVIRSVNAYFKGWEDSVEDSVNDPLEYTGAAIPRGGCVCPFIPQSLGCGKKADPSCVGPGACLGDPLCCCSGAQRVFGIECTPKGCDPKAESTPITCREDTIC